VSAVACRTQRAARCFFIRRGNLPAGFYPRSQSLTLSVSTPMPVFIIIIIVSICSNFIGDM